MIIKISNNGQIEYTCNCCGNNMEVDPTGYIKCTTCDDKEKIFNMSSFVKRHNDTQNVMTELPNRLDIAIHKFIGLSMNQNQGEIIKHSIEQQLMYFESIGQIHDWKLYHGNGNLLECDFYLPAIPGRAITLSLELEY